MAFAFLYGEFLKNADVHALVHIVSKKEGLKIAMRLPTFDSRVRNPRKARHW
jgi:hypothetical protein